MEVWQETFPNQKNTTKAKMEERKERAKIAKEIEEKMANMTQEELDAYMEQIPEWKRGALMVAETEEEQMEQRKGVYRRTKEKLSAKINETEAYQRFKKSEEYDNLQKLRNEYAAEYQEFKGNLKEGIDMSHSPIV